MFMFKKHIPRRAVLKGGGAALLRQELRLARVELTAIPAIVGLRVDRRARAENHQRAQSAREALQSSGHSVLLRE